MAVYIAKRLVVFATMLLGLLCITFAIANVAPGDLAALAAGPNATRAMVETIRKEYGLDRSLAEQFQEYVFSIARGDLGRSISTAKPVMEQLKDALPNTIELVLVAMGLGIVGGVLLGVAAAVWRDHATDHAVRIFTVSGIALPTFWLAILLQLIFAVHLGWLPVSGRIGLITERPEPITHLLILDSLLRGQWHTAGEAFSYILLPAIVLSFPCMASITRVARAEMIETLSTDYVLGARAQGLSSFSIQVKHALRNAMLPILALIGLRYGWMIGGTALVETVFDWPGLGLLVVNSALMSDFKPVLGVTLIIGLNVMLVNFMIDLCYAWVDPRLRSR